MNKQQVKDLRLASGLSQDEFAALGGASKGACAQWEAGTSGIRAATWDLIRARVCLRQGHQERALDVLREAL